MNNSFRTLVVYDGPRRPKVRLGLFSSSLCYNLLVSYESLCAWLSARSWRIGRRIFLENVQCPNTNVSYITASAIHSRFQEQANVT